MLPAVIHDIAISNEKTRMVASRLYDESYYRMLFAVEVSLLLLSNVLSNQI